MSSHRIAPFISAKNILVLEHGEIKEFGAYQRLIQHNGYFQWLYQNQTS